MMSILNLEELLIVENYLFSISIHLFLDKQQTNIKIKHSPVKHTQTETK